MRATSLLFGLLAVTAGGQSRAQTASLTFRTAVDAAWARYPQRQDFEAGRAEAATRDASGRAFFPNAPYLTGTYVNDKVAGSNLNYITAQGELSTPVWLPGEGGATSRRARADAAAIDADGEVAHLEVAAQVLDASEQASLAAGELQVASRQAEAAQDIAAHVDRRYRIGESAESDSLAAQAEAAQARLSLASAQSAMHAADAALQSLIGVDAVPRLAAPRPGQIPPEDTVLANHPRMIAADRAVVAAQANARLTRIENRDSPELGVQAIDEKQPGSRWDTRVGVVFRLPFATQARNAPRRAAVEQAVTHAYVQREIVRRDVLVAFRTAVAGLAGAQDAEQAARSAEAALTRRRGQIERAWQEGEMSLIELLRAEAAAFGAQSARDRAEINLQVAAWRLQLAEGDLP